MTWLTALRPPTLPELTRAARRLADAATALPRLTFAAVRHGVLPTPASAASVLLSEGPWGLPWKVIGDALVRFAQRSGPLTTKLGQVLATRSDLLPEAVCVRLEALYARQPAMGERQLDAALRAAFPRGLPFEAFQRQPIGVGSIGQVHRAELVGGGRVIVKLVRPGLEHQIDRDLNAVELLLQPLLQLPGFGSEAARLAISRALADLGAALRAEVDLRREAAALDDFGRRLRRNPRVCVPRVYREWCSERALVMEQLEGEPISAYRVRAQTDPEAARKVADLALREILTQVFEDGRFHADPHAGNLLVLPDGRLGLIDLGLTGESGAQDRRRIARAVRAFVSGDAEALTRALLDFGVPPSEFSHADFRADVLTVVRQHETQLVAHVTGRNGLTAGPRNGLETFVNDLLRVAYRHGLYVPPSTTLLIKAIVTIEGVARSLNPNLNVVAAALPIVVRALRPRWIRWNFWRELGNAVAAPIAARARAAAEGVQPRV
jgi:ubiquinone biosynthesis protein